MVVGPAALDALGGPPADVTVLDRLRICGGGRVRRGDRIGHRREEPVAHAAVVGHVVVDTQPFDGPGAAAQGDVQPLRADALDRLQLVDIRADLQDRAGLDVASQFRVGDLVVVWPPDRRPVGALDAKQEVGVASPGAVEERRLIDDVRTRSHGLDRGCGGSADPVAIVVDGAIGLDGHDRPALRGQVGEVARLVLEAAFPDDIELGIVAHRAFDETREGGTLELRQVLAGEIGDQIRGGVDGSAVDRLHVFTLPATRVSLPVAGGATLGRCEPSVIQSGPIRRNPRASASGSP